MCICTREVQFVILSGSHESSHLIDMNEPINITINPMTRAIIQGTGSLLCKWSTRVGYLATHIVLLAMPGVITEHKTQS